MRTLLAVLTLAFLSAPLSLAQDQIDFLKDLSERQHLKEMLPEYWKREAKEHLAKRRQTVAAISNEQQLAARRAYIRKTMEAAIGGFPERTPLNAKKVGEIQRDGYRIEKIIFESQPNFFVTGNLYIPTTGSGPFPAVLYPLGHERGGKSYPVWQQMLGSLAKKGFVAFTWDPLGQGERAQNYDTDFKRRKAGGSTTEHSMLGVQCILTGDNVARYTIWDGLRALDYMLSRPEVDASRVGCTGNSGGGTHTAYLSALDDRIKVAAPSCYITGWNALLDTIGPQDAEQVLLPWIGAGLDHSDFIYAFAPKPYLMLSAVRDFFSISGARSMFSEMQDVYGRLDRKVQMSMSEVDMGHGYHEGNRLAAYDWFARWLKGSEDKAPEPEVVIAEFEELQCTPTGQVATSLGGCPRDARPRRAADSSPHGRCGAAAGVYARSGTGGR
jgi:dienelactone hydrolase